MGDWKGRSPCKGWRTHWTHTPLWPYRDLFCMSTFAFTLQLLRLRPWFPRGAWECEILEMVRDEMHVATLITRMLLWAVCEPSASVRFMLIDCPQASPSKTEFIRTHWDLGKIPHINWKYIPLCSGQVSPAYINMSLPLEESPAPSPGNLENALLDCREWGQNRKCILPKEQTHFTRAKMLRRD